MIVLLPRVIRPGMKGDDVFYLKRALSEAGCGKWLGPAFTKTNGRYNVQNIKKFQKKVGLKQDGVYGETTHKKLAKYYDRYGAKGMNDMYVKIHMGPAEKSIAAALDIYNYCRMTGKGVYTQSGLRMSIVRNKWRPPFFPHTLFEDCSSSVTGEDWIAGNPDPNGLGYNGQGFTGTLAVHGTRVAKATKAALGFYGNYPYKHVVRCIGFRGDGTPLVFSWGSGLPKIHESNYRGDFSHWRRYY